MRENRSGRAKRRHSGGNIVSDGVMKSRHRSRDDERSNMRRKSSPHDLRMRSRVLNWELRDCRTTLCVSGGR